MSLSADRVYCVARPIIGLCQTDIEAEFGNPITAGTFEQDKIIFSAPKHIVIPVGVGDSARQDELIATYDGPKPGPDYWLYVQYLSGVAHQVGITLCGGMPFPEEFIKYWLDRNADASASAHPWKSPDKPLVGVRFWVRKDDTLTFVTAEYKIESDGYYRMRFKTERLYD